MSKRTPPEQTVVVAGVDHELPISAEATTSRTLVHNDLLRVVTFAFDADEQLTEHTAAMPVVVQVHTGSVRFEVAGRTDVLTPGDCVYLAAREPHSLRALEPSRLSLVMVTVERS